MHCLSNKFCSVLFSGAYSLTRGAVAMGPQHDPGREEEMTLMNVMSGMVTKIVYICIICEISAQKLKYLTIYVVYTK